MNVERMLELADCIEKSCLPGVRFNMGDWIWKLPLFNKCHTSACIAGWAVLLFDPEGRHHAYVKRRAMELLGLEGRQAEWLFYGNWYKGELNTCPPEAAVAEIRRMANAAREPAPAQ